SSDDVGPGATADLLAALVDRDRLEYVVAAVVGFGDVLHRCGGGDFVARHDGLAPLELLAAVHHHREVELDLGVEDRGPDRRRAVDDREHRGREQVGVAGRASRIQVHAHGIALADRPRVLADLLAPDGVGHGLVGLADRFGVDRHRAAGVYAHARAGGATAASPTRAARRRPPEAPPAGVTGERSEGRRGPVARPHQRLRVRVALAGRVHELDGVGDDADGLAFLLLGGLPLTPAEAAVHAHATAAAHVRRDVLSA